MAFDPIEAAKNLFPAALISRAASSLGETEGSIQKALSSAIPCLLAGLLGKSSGSGANNFLDIAKAAAGTGIVNNLTGFFDGGGNATVGAPGDTGVTLMGWLRSIFGDKLNNIVNAVSGFAGIKYSSASAVLSMAAPATLAPLGKYAIQNNFTASDLGSFLQSQKSAILSAIPAGLNLTGALGINSLGDIGAKLGDTLPSARGSGGDTVKNVSSGKKWIWPLLILLAIAALTWFFIQKGCGDSTTPINADTTMARIAPVPLPITAPPGPAGRLDTSTGNYIYDHGEETALTLADGTVLKVGENSTEAILFNMLNDPNWSIDTTDKTKNWVTFNRLYFETGQSILTAESQAQIRNVAAILKNFPSGSIKIGGYTDNTGDAAVNKRISDSRAKTVMRELIKAGAGVKQVTEAVGYGIEHPVCAANDTPACKAQNRRVDLKVASK